uniref:Uncharacterized protein n=1 Tax=Anguilla anguilla TaxID=7936 RepID=A0A0E9P8L4_ANGAN
MQQLGASGHNYLISMLNLKWLKQTWFDL